ncbi:Uncharacterised protein [Mycobacteroides abscessus subsp. bolletii]|nr:Uncharacterised protein [Mycobacteroides abscessus subsp. bolletii]
MTKTTNGTLVIQTCGRRSTSERRASTRSRSGTRITLGALALRAFARALACRVLVAGRIFSGAWRCTGIGMVCGAERRGRAEGPVAVALDAPLRRLVGFADLAGLVFLGASPAFLRTPIMRSSYPQLVRLPATAPAHYVD